MCNGEGKQDLFSLLLHKNFMKPRINEVDELLAKGVNVTNYSGQLDLICSTKGTEAWVAKAGRPTDFFKHEQKSIVLWG
ncbi:hypothetical protein ACET3Z_006137 [Daucus carota]